MEEIFIVGGGICGMVCAYLIKKSHPSYQVTIIEKDSELGKRIKISGNGRCNFSNANVSDDKYFFNQDYIKDIIDDYLLYQKDLLKELNIHYYADDEGRMYPVTNSAKTIHSLLLDALYRVGVNIHLNEEVISCSDKEIITYKSTYHYDKLVIAIGGISYLYSLDNHKFLKDLKIDEAKFIPTLCPITIKEKLPKELEGKRLRGLISLYKDTDLVYQERGEVLFKKDGLSGIAIFNISAFIANDLTNVDHYHIKINAIEGVTKEEIESQIATFKKFNTLKSYVNEELASYLNSLSLDPYTLLSSLTFNVKGLYNFKDSQVSKGGVKLNQLNTNLSLKQNPNIFIGGEALDVNALCGGYNIFFAFASAYAISKNI